MRPWKNFHFKTTTVLVFTDLTDRIELLFDFLLLLLSQLLLKVVILKYLYVGFLDQHRLRRYPSSVVDLTIQKV